MALKKADYFAQGHADAMAGKPRKAIAAATWQAAAYDGGYDIGVRDAQAKIAYDSPRAQDEKALPKKVLVQAFLNPQRRVYSDESRRMEARVERINQRIARASL